MKFGQFELQLLSDGFFRLDGGAMFGVVPRVLWQKKFQPDERNRIRLALNSLLILGGKQAVLVETGIGDKMSAKQVDIYGIEHTTTLPASLRTHGLGPDDIDMVVDTHLHFDHCGWNTRRASEGSLAPTFPRAHYYVQAGELEHARQPTERDRASFLPENFEPMQATHQWTPVMGDKEILPGVELVRVPGHTRDMQCVRVRSQGRTAFFFADMVPTTAHLPFAWIMGYDLYPLETLEQKKRWIPQAVREEWLCFFVHDPAVPAAYLRQKGDEVVAEPAPEFAPTPVS